MGAVPKNKITSAERGKRRAGQGSRLKKQLNKDPNQSAAPKHKRGLVAAMFSQMGFEFKKLIKR